MTPETRRHTGRKTTSEAERPGVAAGSAADSAYAATARQGPA
ncbi:hypothetical protein [Thiocapsa sp.]|nr:hypothetical protein [Thiocapsa sp.]